MDFLDELSEDFSELLAQSNPYGKVPAVTAVIERPLSEADLAEYVAKDGNLPTPSESDVQKLRSRHHSVARLLAAGVPEAVVAEITGYTAAHISSLKDSPSMQQLLAHYRAPGNHAAQMIAEKLRLVADMSLEQLGEKIKGDQLSASELIAAAKLGFDRSGHGPQSTLHTISENRVIDVAELARLDREAREANAELIVPVETVRQALPKPSERSDGDVDTGEER